MTLEDIMSIVNRSESHAKPASQEIAQRTGHMPDCQSHAGQALNSKLGRPDRQLCQDPRFDCRGIPGFENFNERIRGLLHLPHSVRDRREFPNQPRKAKVTAGLRQGQSADLISQFKGENRSAAHLRGP